MGNFVDDKLTMKLCTYRIFEKFCGFITTVKVLSRNIYIVNYNRGFLANVTILAQTVFSSYNCETFHIYGIQY